MKILTVATKEEGYFGLLRQTAGELGYTLVVLGWNEKWQGFHRKIILYTEALAKIPADEAVVCVDGYDVVVVGPAAEMHKKFVTMNAPLVFSGQRYFPSRKWIRQLADKVMSNRKNNTIGKSNHIFDYSRPCTGLFAGYAGALHGLFHHLTELNNKEHINDDQVLLNIYYLNHPDSIILDSRCELFQNLWRTERGFYGRISPASKRSEIDIIRFAGRQRIKNRKFHTMPCFMHGPFNLDLSLALKELGLNPQKPSFKKGWNYWNYSLLHHIGRGIRFYSKEFLLLLLLLCILLLLLMLLK